MVIIPFNFLGKCEYDVSNSINAFANLRVHHYVLKYQIGLIDLQAIFDLISVDLIVVGYD